MEPNPGPPPGLPERRQGPRRRLDRLGLTADGRRATDVPPNRNPTAREEQRHLVRYLAADPDRLAWLRAHVAKHMARVAADLDAAGEAEAARLVNRAAWEHRLGTEE